MTMNAGTLLEVDPGVVVKFVSNAGLTIHGILTAVGTQALPIAFTSWRDDFYGGDLNLDGSASTPVNGDWRTIYITDQAVENASLIEHAVLRYGGGANSAMFYSFRTNLTIRNSTLSNSSVRGLRVHLASLTMENNEIFGNSADGVHLENSGTHTLTGGRIYANFSDGIELLNSVGLTVSGTEIFANLGQGLRNSSNQTIGAENDWWGATDGPGGEGPGSGDQILNTGSGSIDADPFLTAGSDFSYYNAGPHLSEGAIAGPSVTQGTDTTEFGTGSSTRMLYDLDQVILDYPTVDAGKRFDLLVTYYNPDDTSGIGGDIQRLEADSGLLLHGSLGIPGGTPTQFNYRLPAEAHDTTSALELNFIRENGYRAVVSEVWLVERSATSDIAAPVSAITSPTAGAHLTGGLVEIIGTADDGAGAGVAGVFSVEVGVENGGAIEWRPVTQLRGDGGWSYRWNLPGDGPYTLYSRGRDRVGNLEAPAGGVAVVVNQTAPAAITGLSASDTPSDSGGSIDLLWNLSLDDGEGADDVINYAIERREDPLDPFVQVGSLVGAGISSFTDATTVDGTGYEYRVVTIDQAGNRSVSGSYLPVISIDNDGSDLTAPEEVTGLNGTPGNGFVYLEWTGSVDSANDLVDQLLDISVDFGANWGTNAPLYDDGGTISLGKEADFRLVSSLSNGTAYRFRIRVKDSSDNTSTGGTATTGDIIPSATAFTNVSGTLSSDTTWAAGVFYVSSNLTVNSGVTLTIQPGVMVKFAANRELRINGALQAVGTVSDPIVFTAWTDDDYAGDTNNDGAASSGAPGYWSRIYIPDASGTSRLEETLVRYGGSSNTGNIYVLRSSASILSSTIEQGSSYGLYIYQNSSQARTIRSGTTPATGSATSLRAVPSSGATRSRATPTASGWRAAPLPRSRTTSSPATPPTESFLPARATPR